MRPRRRRRSVFWGLLLVLIGIALLLSNAGLLAVDVWSLIGPLILIALGVAFLWRILVGGGRVAMEEVSIPLNGAGRARIQLSHGAGRLRVDGSASGTDLLSGSFGGGVERRVSREGDMLVVNMRLPDAGLLFFRSWTWMPGESLDWTVGLNPGIPLDLSLETGASDARLDLTDLRIVELTLQTGASATDVRLPAQAGYTRATIKSGVAAVAVHVPEGVAARIRASGGLASVDVDRSRFPRTGDHYQSPDYDTAENSVDLTAETGVGSILVH